MKIRTIMAVIPAIALISWLVSTARHVNQDRDRHIWHLSIHRATGAISLEGHAVPFHFASRFWDALIGRDWTVGYACPCGIGSNPNLIEVGRAARNQDLLQKSNAWAKPYQRSMELAIELDSRRKTVEHNQAVIDRLDRDVAWAAWNGSWIHGSEGVRKTYQEGIDNHLAHIARARALLAKYRAAALHPWDPIEPDPPPEARGGSTNKQGRVGRATHPRKQEVGRATQPMKEPGKVVGFATVNGRVGENLGRLYASPSTSAGERARIIESRSWTGSAVATGSVCPPLRWRRPCRCHPPKSWPASRSFARRTAPGSAPTGSSAGSTSTTGMRRTPS